MEERRIITLEMSLIANEINKSGKISIPEGDRARKAPEVADLGR